jgi:serine/threonine protein kinase
MLGKLLNERYLILKQLGTGGFSTTYLCRDRSLPNDPICVVKVIEQNHPDLNDVEVERLFMREAQILYKLSKHPQIPLLLARRMENNERYLVTEYVEGDDLAQLTQQKRLPQKQALALIEGLFEVLKFVHSRQIVHRDIKPSNLIQRQSDLKLVMIDFGSAIDLTKPSEDQGFGTHGYMAPEQQDGNPSIRSDLYAAGITAIELLTGVSPTQLLRHSQTGELELEPLLKLHRVPQRLQDILVKLTRFQAKERYANAAQVINDLKKLTKPQRRRQSSRLNRPVLPVSIALTLGATTLTAIGTGQAQLPGQALQQLWETFTAAVPRSLLPGLLQPPQIDVALLQSVQTGLLEQVVGGSFLIARNVKDQVTIWDWSGNRLVELPSRANQDIHSMVLSPNGNRLALLYNQEIQIWSVPEGNLRRTLPIPATEVESMALGIDGATLAIANGQRIQIWDVRESRLTQNIDARAWGDRITFLSYLPNNLLVCGSPDHRLHLWEAATGRRTQTLAGHQADVTTAQLSANSQELYTLGQDRLLIWDWQTRTLNRALPPQSGSIVQLAAQKNGYLLGLHGDGRLTLWNELTGRLVDAKPPYAGLTTLNREGTRLVQSQNNQLNFYEISTHHALP